MATALIDSTVSAMLQLAELSLDPAVLQPLHSAYSHLISTTQPILKRDRPASFNDDEVDGAHKHARHHLSGLLKLPSELQTQILLNCDARTLSLVERVCRTYRPPRPSAVSKAVMGSLLRQFGSERLGALSWPALLGRWEHVAAAARCSEKPMENSLELALHGAGYNSLCAEERALWSSFYLCTRASGIHAAGSELASLELQNAAEGLAEISSEIEVQVAGHPVDAHGRAAAEGMVASGAVPLLVRLLDGSTPLAKEHASCALSKIALFEQHCEVLNEAGAVPALVRVMCDGTDSAKEHAAYTMASMSHCSEYWGMMMQAGVVQAVAAILCTGSARAKEEAADIISELVGMESHCIALVEGGVVPSLIRTLEPYEHPDPNSFAAMALLAAVVSASKALGTIACYSSQCTLLVEAGIVPLLVQLLSSDQEHLRSNACGALANIAACGAFRGEIVRNGAVGRLLDLLAGWKIVQGQQQPQQMQEIHSSTKDAAARALCTIISDVPPAELPQLMPQIGSVLVNSAPHSAAQLCVARMASLLTQHDFLTLSPFLVNAASISDWRVQECVMELLTHKLPQVPQMQATAQAIKTNLQSLDQRCCAGCNGISIECVPLGGNELGRFCDVCFQTVPECDNHTMGCPACDFDCCLSCWSLHQSCRKNT